jgi:hypothetical protein
MLYRQAPDKTRVVPPPPTMTRSMNPLHTTIVLSVLLVFLANHVQCTVFSLNFGAYGYFGYLQIILSDFVEYLLVYITTKSYNNMNTNGLFFVAQAEAWIKTWKRALSPVY